MFTLIPPEGWKSFELWFSFFGFHLPFFKLMQVNYKIAESKEQIIDYLKGSQGSIMFFDTESVGLSYGDHILGFSFYNVTTDALFIPTNNYFAGGFSYKVIKEIFDVHFTHEAVAHNAKYDLGVFSSAGLSDPKVIADTLLMIHCYNPELEKNLEKRVKADFGWDKPTFKELVGKKWENIDWTADGLLSVLAEYACEDTYGTYLLYEKYRKLLEKEDLLKIHDRIELPLTYVLRDMFVRGVRVDVPLLKAMDAQLDKEILSVEKKIYEEANCVFNLNSPKQKAEVLFDKMGLPCYRTTKTGGRSTDSETFEMLDLEGYPIGKYLNEYSKLGKLSSGYTKSIPPMVYADGKLRCNFNSTGTKTGRFSSDNPNLQNQPVNEQFPIRQAFIPCPGYEFDVIDYSQIELRLMAHVSQDPILLKAFRDGADIHGKVADDLGIPRKGAKVVNFGVLYGMGPAKLAATLGISERDAKEIVRNYEDTYVGYKNWKTRTEAIAERTGKITTIFGRVRRLPDAFSDNKKLYYGAMRKAVNTVVQGSAADLIKIAMLKLHQTYKENRMDSHLLLQVHDELVIESRFISHKTSQERLALNKHIMETAVTLSVPIVADAKICNNWNDMKAENTAKIIHENKDLIIPYHLYI